MKAAFNKDGWPPELYSSIHASLPAVTWGFPEARFKDTTTTSSTATAALQVTVDAKQFHMPGYAMVRDEGEEEHAVWYCDCTAENCSIRRQITALHMCPSACAQIQDADCPHVKYLQYMMSVNGVSDLREFLDTSLVEKETELQSGTAHHVLEVTDEFPAPPTTTARPGLFFLGQVHVANKGKCALHQAGAWGAKGISTGLLIDGRCVTCKNSNNKCVHNSIYTREAVVADSGMKTHIHTWTPV